MNDLVVIGQTIKDKRLSLNMRMEDLAKKANITRATLWSIEKGDGKCSLSSLINVMNILGLSLNVDNNLEKCRRNRATRLNTLLDKKKNRFIVMCVEQYAKSVNQSSGFIYKQMNEKGIINDLLDDYIDLHGMSTMYLNDYIGSLLNN